MRQSQDSEPSELLFTFRRPMSHVKMYLILIIISVTATASADCPTECYCSDGDTTTCIGDRRLTALPKLHLISPIKRLEIRDYFLPNLRLEPVPFALIKELCLSYNQIEKFHVVSSGVAAAAAAGLDLKLLDLSFNNLTHFVSIKGLSSLKILDLSHNRIERVSLEGLDKLESLNLRSNSIEELSEDAFQPLKSVHYINLDSNRLKKLSPNLFSNLPALAHLILSSNPLNLSPGFLFNSRTQFIDVSNTGLDRIPSSMTKTIRDLRLNNNKLKRILESDFESYPIVGLLVLDENQIESIEDDAMGRLDFLTSLWLNGNRLTQVPQNLPSSLKSLQLEENRIKVLNLSDFQRLRNLQNLNLHGNQITTLEPGTFSPLVSLTTLSLRSNLIDSILANSFINLTQLETLDLSQNPLKVIVNGAFNIFTTKLSSLHISRMSEPDISFHVSVFQPLQSLQTLNLRSSPFIAQKLARAGSFGYFKSLKELNIENCQLVKADLQGICSGLSELDISTTYVRILKAGENLFNSTDTGLIKEHEHERPEHAEDDDEESSADTLNFLPILCPTATGGTLNENSDGYSESATKVPGKDSDSESIALTSTTTTNHADAISSSSTSSTYSHDSWSSLREKMQESHPSPSPSPRPGPSPSPTFASSTSTSSYFEKKNRKSSSSTNEDVAVSVDPHSPQRNGDTSPSGGGGKEEEPELPEERRSIDGFPADMSAKSSSSAAAAAWAQEQDDDDFAKGSFHQQRLPPRMHLKAAAEGEGPNGNSNTSLILKTILISAGTCTLSVLILLFLGLIFFRLNGGRFVRRRNGNCGTETQESYKRLEEKQQELELGISNRVYFEDGQVYHIS